MSAPLVFRSVARGGEAPAMRDRRGQPVPGLERDIRLDHIAEGLQGCRFEEPSIDSGLLETMLARVHDAEYLRFLSLPHNGEFNPRWHAPGVAPDTALGPESYAAALQAACCALAAAGACAQGEPVTYALCRPPGHHAGRDFMGGYCLLNNAVSAVHRLLESGMNPVALIDLDFHFGNGSAQLTAGRSDCFFASIHADTSNHFPYTPEGLSSGQMSRSFKSPPTRESWLSALRDVLAEADARGCKVLVISLGFDIIAGDPHGGWQLPPSIFADIGEQLKETGLPLCLIQEGGYHLPRLADCAAFLCSDLVPAGNPA
ncbi:MAG: hypothetical protein QNK37_19080 [Acidobacteriota bacterium]|nr:hypothetical protein [Acidobacteriota bacterium]